MPLYEYECESCGARIERIQKFSDPPLQTCPTCGGPLRKLISSPAIQFKGSGWYITDYARKGGSDGKAAEAKADGKDQKDAPKTTKSDTGSTSESATPSKPADGGGTSSPAKSEPKT